MASFLATVADQLNLRWAWEKVRNEAQPGDIWFDEIELAAFELELEKNLESIGRELFRGSYIMTSLKPLPFPKDPDEEGNPRLRQTFQIATRDQVAWTAVVNVVGPYVDLQMPVWSYGHRLYRNIWIEKDSNGIKHRKIGHYRHSSGHLYLPFRQSWPIFRRHIYLAIRAMANLSLNNQMDEPDNEELSLQKELPKPHQCPFVMDDYWQNRRPSGKDLELYWCSIDLKKFYPSLKLDIIQKNIVKCLPFNWHSEAAGLLKSMLKFRLNRSGWIDNELGKLDLSTKHETFSHIPTGLYVAGFLSNAGLLEVDKAVQEHLNQYDIAHFRYVDDHIMLAYSFDDLLNWVNNVYAKLLSEKNTGTRINVEKIEPKELAGILDIRTKSQKKLMSSKTRPKRAVVLIHNSLLL